MTTLQFGHPKIYLWFLLRVSILHGCMICSISKAYSLWGQHSPTMSSGKPKFLSTLPQEPLPNTDRLKAEEQPHDERKRRIRIRQALETDLRPVASFLLAAEGDDLSSTSSNTPWWNTVQNKLDQLFAQSDIESLLRNRFYALQEGRIVFQRTKAMMIQEVEWSQSSKQDIPGYADGRSNSENNKIEEKDDLLLLQVWWNHRNANEFKSLLQKASQETGEDNLWRDHNFALTPRDKSWLNHLQMTAVDSCTGEVIGFCELAMLSNPLVNDTMPGLLSSSYSPSTMAFAPAISNLATAPHWRRRGVATRLLRSASRYAGRYWGTTQLALYVEETNQAAMKLYEKMGFRKEMRCSSSDDNNPSVMWYMVQEYPESITNPSHPGPAMVNTIDEHNRTEVNYQLVMV